MYYVGTWTLRASLFDWLTCEQGRQMKTGSPLDAVLVRSIGEGFEF